MAALDGGRYLLGVAELALLGGFAWLGAARVRGWVLPRFEAAPAWLATGVLALAILLWAAELLGTFGLLEPLPYVLAVVAIGTALRVLVPNAAAAGGADPGDHPGALRGVVAPERRQGPPAEALGPRLVALLVGAIALALFAWEGRDQIGSGMTGFDSTWYHGPFAAGFFQSGDTWGLHFIAPQFLAWFYPANSELLHGVGMLAFGRDVLSPLLNLGWFAGCLLACWCIGRPYGVAPWSLALGAIALSVPAFADQAGEARNDIVGTFFLLSAVALAVNGWALRDGEGTEAGPGDGLGGGGLSVGPLAVAGLAAGLAAGTKLNFLLPAAVFVVGLAVVAPRGARSRALWVSGLAALAGGGYWYLRNLAHTGNPLPWVDSLGPISLPAPDQALGGREAHSVLGYLGDGAVWSEWLLPGLRDGLWFLWPLVLLAALAGLVLAILPSPGCSSSPSGRRKEQPREGALALAGLVGLAAALAWLLAPTSASGPEGAPRGFESGLRYLAPALVLGLALLPAAPLVRKPLARLAAWSPFHPQKGGNGDHTRPAGGNGDHTRVAWGAGLGVLLVAIVVGYAYQRHYLENRYADPSFAAPGLNAAFAWARDVSDARIATTATRQYPLFGTDLSNRVEFLGEERPHGGFEAPTTCRAYLRLLDEGDYDFVVASKDRLEPGKPPFPQSARWIAAAGAEVILKTPPTVVYQLKDSPDLSACSR